MKNQSNLNHIYHVGWTAIIQLQNMWEKDFNISVSQVLFCAVENSFFLLPTKPLLARKICCTILALRDLARFRFAKYMVV